MTQSQDKVEAPDQPDNRTASPTQQGRHHPVDQYRPLRNLLPFGLQHVLVMAAAPISTVFLISRSLGLSPDLTSSLMTSVFVFSGLGTLLQSLGRWGFGVRLPFVMLPGGASTVLFLSIAAEYDLQVAAGAVLITGVFYILMATVFVRILKYFPPLVIGTMVVVIGVNLVGIGGMLITGPSDAPGFADPMRIALAMITIGFIVLFLWLLRGMLRQLAIMLGLVAGTCVSAILGATDFSRVADGPVASVPTFLPFGAPHFVILAAIPMIIWSLGSMAEGTGQTVVNAEIVGKDLVQKRDVPRVLRADGLTSLFGGFFGTPVMVTSGENLGVIRASGVRSRFVTATAGVLLIIIGISPLARVLDGIPGAVVGGTALVVFAMITVLGIQMLRRVDFNEMGNFVTCTVALAFGLAPIVAPGIYSQLPESAQGILDSGVAMSAIVAVVLNLLFNHAPRPFQARTSVLKTEPASTTDEKGPADK